MRTVYAVLVSAVTVGVDLPGVAAAILSLRNLLELMLLISDNSATDLVMRAAGGPEAVSRRTQALGVEGLSVDRPMINLIADWVGIEEMPPRFERSPDAFRKLYEATTPEQRVERKPRWRAQHRSTARVDPLNSMAWRTAA